MIICAEPEIHIRYQSKVVLFFSNYVTKKELNDVAGVKTSNSAAKRDFTALKADVDNLHINKLVNATTNLNNLKTTLNELDAGRLKTISVDLKNQIMHLKMYLREYNFIVNNINQNPSIIKTKM